MGTPVVLITGALTGIGRPAARAFAREGNRIVVAGRHETAPARRSRAELRALGTDVEFLCADVRHEDEVRRLIDRTVARFWSAGRGRQQRRHRRPARSGVLVHDRGESHG
jgi:NAD(P)-dependent dehydrogenase (short-subunit alcohol dehydrogenase family)